MTGSLARSIKAEWRKASTTKLLWIMAAAALAFVGLNVLLIVLVAPDTAPQLIHVDVLMDPGYITNAIAAAGGASIFVLIVGIIAMTGEYRHMTITSTLLASPVRSRVVVAKGIAYAVLGAVVGVISGAFATALAFLLLLGHDHAPLAPGTIATVAFGVALGLAIYAIVGVSVGALIKNQIAAIIIAIVWILLVEPLLGLFLDGLRKWLPGGALSASMNVTTTNDLTAANLLPVWGGALLLLGYAVVFAAIASVTTVRRDIT